MTDTIPFFENTRGTSTNVQYVLTLSVAMLMLTGVTASIGGIVDDRRQNVAEDQLEAALGETTTELYHENQIRTNYDSATNYASSTLAVDRKGYDVIVYVDTPDLFKSQPYIIQVAEDGDKLIARTTGSGQTYKVTQKLDSSIPIQEGSGAPGRSVAIVYDEGESQYRIVSQTVAEDQSI